MRRFLYRLLRLAGFSFGLTAVFLLLDAHSEYGNIAALACFVISTLQFRYDPFRDHKVHG
jgi:uncharacterized membrane protein